MNDSATYVRLKSTFRLILRGHPTYGVAGPSLGGSIGHLSTMLAVSVPL